MLTSHTCFLYIFEIYYIQVSLKIFYFKKEVFVTHLKMLMQFEKAFAQLLEDVCNIERKICDISKNVQRLYRMSKYYTI